MSLVFGPGHVELIRRQEFRNAVRFEEFIVRQLRHAVYCSRLRERERGGFLYMTGLSVLLLFPLDKVAYLGERGCTQSSLRPEQLSELEHCERRGLLDSGEVYMI